jgi:hypothetical protein
MNIKASDSEQHRCNVRLVGNLSNLALARVSTVTLLEWSWRAGELEASARMQQRWDLQRVGVVKSALFVQLRGLFRYINSKQMETEHLKKKVLFKNF